MENKFEIGQIVYIISETNEGIEVKREEITEESGEEYRAGSYWSWNTRFYTKEEVKERMEEFLE